MGVTGLWSIVQPCARPTKIETLNRKRLAVDASIWIYQFLKAVRDKEGNALRNSHVVGFFRRICKLLFFGIKPVFVFDGGAPALKRSVIQQRKRRREGRRDDAVRTAGKLLAVQMQRRAEEEEAKRKEASRHPRQPVEEEVPDGNMVYVDELFNTPQEQQQSRSKFRKKDAYHLPELDLAMSEMGGPNDPRVMSLEELQTYARQFDSGEDINVYDFSKIDYDSPFFTSLPASDRYNILNAARLRSRLRMGHSKEQLDTMFPDRMAFSKFQIERVTERNELTQRLMHVHEGGEGAFDGMGRVAGEKGREYVLVKNDGVEGGWALGVVSNEGRTMTNAIELDQPVDTVKAESSSDDDADFEDVAIEGLNRLPKLSTQAQRDKKFAKQRQALYRNRRKAARRPRKVRAEDPESLFVAQDEEPEEELDDQDKDGLSGELDQDETEEDAELRRAIEMSLQQDKQDETASEGSAPRSEDDFDGADLETFQQAAVSEALPVPKGSGRAIANIVNKRAYNAAPESYEVTSFGVPVPKYVESGPEDEDSMDLTAALAESRQTKRRKTPPGPRFLNVPPQTPTAGRRQHSSTPKKPAMRAEDSASDIAKAHGFSGPLPFEKLDLGSSLLGKKKMQERQAQAAGGFDNSIQDQPKTGPLPPWFSGNLEKDLAKQKEMEEEDRERQKRRNEQFQFEKANAPLHRHDTKDVIDLEADDEPVQQPEQIISIDEDDLDEQVTASGAASDGSQQELSPASETAVRQHNTLDEVAEDVRADPPTPGISSERQPASALDDTQEEDPALALADRGHQAQDAQPVGGSLTRDEPSAAEQPPQHLEEHGREEEIEWSASEDEAAAAKQTPAGPAANVPSRSPSVEFEDVSIPDQPVQPARRDPVRREPSIPERPLPTLEQQDSVPADDVFDDFSDPEDEELMRSLAQEAEEHARFESSLNQKTVAQNIADYERELKQLRNQQKKDRRDADEVTHIMITECQQLLRLFGLPFITAPMEAEAQCAELVRLGLVDGIVTDDSDCFLFGGTRVYKNVFNQAKFVECYLSSDMQKEFDLTREKMISVAQLLGSDYTEGLSGVGPVTALEIIAEFGELEDFKKWWIGVQNLSVPKEADSASVFRKKFRKNAQKLFLPPAFPDERVSMAYLQPEVDSSDQPFMWGVPDLDALRSFLMATIGWSQERTDEVLVPVIRDMNRRTDEGTQANITAFFDGGVGAGVAARGQGGEAFAPRRRIDTSKRLGRAMGLLANQAKGGQRVAGATNEDSAEPASTAKPKGRKSAKTATKKRQAAAAREQDESSEAEGEDGDTNTQKRRRKR